MTKTDINEALQAAVKKGDLATVKQCLQAGAKDPMALNFSSERGHLPIVQHLLGRGVSQAEKNEALWYAASTGCLPVVECLVNDGADFRAKGSQTIIVAAEEDHLEVTQFLVERGADLEIVEEYGEEQVQQWLGII